MSEENENEKRKDIQFYRYELVQKTEIIEKKKKKKKIQIDKKKREEVELKSKILKFLEERATENFTVTQIKNMMEINKRHAKIKELLMILVEETPNIDIFRDNKKELFGVNEFKEKPKKKRKTTSDYDTDEENNSDEGKMDFSLYFEK